MTVTATPSITPIDVRPDHAPGRRARIGLILLATDYATECELRRFMPLAGPEGDDIAFFTSRVPNTNPVTVENLRAMGPELGRAAANILPGGRLDAIAYSCTSGTITIGIEATEAQIAQGRPGIPISTPATAALAAFKALNLRQLSILTPYSESVNAEITRFFTDHGCEIRRFGSFHLDTDEAMSGVRETDVIDAAASIDDPNSEAVFISCTALRAVMTVPALEAKLGKPVITSNQAMFWYALRLAGVQDALPDRGTLLRHCLDGTVCQKVLT